MPLDLFGSARSTAVVLLASASFTSPIVMKSDALAGALGRGGGEQRTHVETAPLIAGGTSFDLPVTWTRMSTPQLSAGRQRGGRSIGAVVSGVCPGGRTGVSCTGDVSVTFISYGRSADEQIPKAAALEAQLDRDLVKRLRGFRKGASKSSAASGGGRSLRYSFTYIDGRAARTQVLTAYRRRDGSGVVAIAEGPAAGMKSHDKAIQRFLGSGADVA